MAPLAPPLADSTPHERFLRITSALPNRLIAAHERESAWDSLEGELLDVLVIGGGITGAGVLHALSKSALRVALVEGADFASGTSGRSSKLIHGGFRYLAQLEFRMVRKTALERAKLHKIAPHLSVPRWMVMPLRTHAQLAFYRSAVWTYEQLGQLSSQDRASQSFTGSGILDLEPSIRRDRYSRAVAFREYQTDDARLVLATLRAAAAQGARALNYAKVEEIQRKAGRFVLRLRCTLTGQLRQLQCKELVNAAGPWVEELQRLESPQAPPLLHLSKGVHIGLDAKKVPVRDGVVLRGADGRYLFALRRGPMVYVGTTDTSFGKHAKRSPEISEQDVRYLLDAVESTLDVGPLRQRDVLSAWSGLRPLIADPRNQRSSEISRKDAISVGELGMISVAGGKLSGFRDMALQVCAMLRERGCPLPPSNRLLDSSVLPGGDVQDSGQSILGVIEAHHPHHPGLARLPQLYGSESRTLAIQGRPLAKHSPLLDVEVDWAVQVEGAQTLEDLVYRRLRIPWFEHQASSNETWQRLAHRMGQLLGWSPLQREQEVREVAQRVRAELAFTRPCEAPLREGVPAGA